MSTPVPRPVMRPPPPGHHNNVPGPGGPPPPPWSKQQGMVQHPPGPQHSISKISIL